MKYLHSIALSLVTLAAALTLSGCAEDEATTTTTTTSTRRVVQPTTTETRMVRTY